MSVELLKSIFDWTTVVLIAGTVVSGAGALITGDIISKRQEAKLRQFDKDLTGARTELGKQQERAANAEHDAAEAKTTAATANEHTLALQKAADDAKAAQQRVEIELANSQAKLEMERLVRLKLQRSVLHRMITVRSVSDYHILEPFKGTLVVFEYSPEGEPGIFAGALAPFAINSQWQMLDKTWLIEANHELPDGVTVEAYVGPNGETDSSNEAADTFADFLRENQKIQGVRRKPAPRGELPPNAVRVLVGQMPDPAAATK